MAALRRSWWVAALLVILSPAGLGAVMPVLHPCETLHHQESQSTQADEVHQHHGADHSAGAAGDSDASHDGPAHCTCIGACHGGTSLLPRAVGSELPVDHLTEVPVAIVSRTPPPPPLLPLDHLPPPTAPPAG